MTTSKRGQRPVMETRLPEQGRIRMGRKDSTGMGRSTPTFRFTSTDREALEQIATTYGGTVQAWSDKTASTLHQWEVQTEATEVAVILPPGAIDSNYELWTQAGLLRRCDGITCIDSSGPQRKTVECICAEQDLLQCQPTTRLRFVLPAVSFGGTWRLETHSTQAKVELPAMVALIEQLTTRSPSGLVEAILGMREKTIRVKGQTKHYNVPYLKTPSSLMGLLNGEADVLSIGTGGEVKMAALPEGSTERRLRVVPDPDDEIVDAEIVEEDDMRPKEASEYIKDRYVSPGGERRAELMAKAHTLTLTYPMARMTDEAMLDAIITLRSLGSITSHLELTDAQVEALDARLDELLSGALVLKFDRGYRITGFGRGTAS